jgi:hypothetical protein
MRRVKLFVQVVCLLGALSAPQLASASCASQMKAFLQSATAALPLKKLHVALLAAVLAGGVDSTALGAIVDSSRMPTMTAHVEPGVFATRTWSGGWPYEFNPLLPDPPGRGLVQRADRAHEQWGDHIYFSQKAGVDFLATSPWRADQMASFNVGPNWVQTTGGWQTYLVPADDEMLLALHWGSYVRYDMTPNTPNLYQFTTFAPTGMPGVVRVTHYSWVLVDNRFTGQFLDQGYQPVPGPGSVVLMGAAVATMLRRRR